MTPVHNLQFLTSGGEIAELIRKKNWSATKIGDPAQWPQSLRTTLNIILHSKFPMFLFWGPSLTCFYNDAFRPGLGNDGKHPAILGEPGENHWGEIWPTIKSSIDKILSGEKAIWKEDVLVPFYRNGETEEVYWTVNYSPVNDDADKLSGILVNCNETTKEFQSRNNLKESNSLLQLTIDVAELATWDLDVKTNQLTGNDRLKIWLGLSLNELFSLESWMERILEKDRKIVRRAIALAQDPSGNGTLELEFTMKNLNTREERIVKAYGRVSFEENKIPFRLNGVLQDVTTQVNARKKIEESELRFRNMAESTSILVAVSDENSKVIYFNQAWATLTGRPEEELLNFGWSEIVHPEDRQRFLDIYLNSFDVQKPWKDEFRVLNAAGDYTWLLATVNVRRHSDGSFAGYIASSVDITDLKLARIKLEKSESHYRKLIEEAPVATGLFTGKDHIIEMANEPMLKFWGRGKEVFGLPLMDALPELKSQKFLDILDNVYKTGITYEEKAAPVELLLNGTLRLSYFDFIHKALTDTNGNVYAIVNMAVDVTEQVLVNKKLEESERNLRLMILQAPVAIGILKGPEFIVSIANNRALELWGRSLEEVNNISILKAMPELKKQGIDVMLQNVFKTGIPFSATEQPIEILRNGKMETLYINFSFEPLYNVDSTLDGLMAIGFDVTSQVLARLKIEESEHRVKTLVNTAAFPIGVYTGKDMIIQLANKAIIDIWGKGPDVIGKKYADVLPELSNQHVFQQLSEVYETGIPFHIQNQEIGLLVNGRLKTFYFNYSFTALFDNNGNVYGVMNTAADVTDIMIAKKIAEDSEEKLNIAIDAAELATWELNNESEDIVYSERYPTIFGYPSDKVLTRGEILKQIHPEDKKKWTLAFEQSYKKGSLYYEVRYIWPDKTIHWVEARGKVFYNSKGEPVKTLGTLKDITEFKNHEKDLIESEQKFRLLANSMPQLVWTSNIDGQFNYFNQSLYNYSGMSPEDIQEKGWLGIVHPDDREENISKWQLAVTTGKDFLLEHRFRRVDGTYRWQLSRAIPKRDIDGNIQMWVGTSTDIEDQKTFTNDLENQVKERTQQLEQKNVDLELMNKELQSFTYISSHDLQEPLRKIQAFSDMIIESELERLSEKGKDKFNRIKNAASRMQQLIDDLLSYSRTTTAERKFEKTPLRRIIEDVKEDLVDEIKDKNVSIVFKDDCDLNIISFQFRQLIYNLFSNAIKFSRLDLPSVITVESVAVNGSQLNIDKLAKEQSYWLITVTDNGIGFDPQYSSKIFELFQRLHGRIQYKGTGIGLAIVKKIVENHNGAILATGEINKGARFEIYIPS